jgi:osmotically-inducible protein OsmY
MKILLLCKFLFNMKTNQELQKDVQNAIKWERSMHAAEIGVTAKDGVVTLSGTVDSYAKKLNAQRATKNVVGVKAITEGIIVDYGNSFRKNDTEIAGDVLNIWKNNKEISADEFKVRVEAGWVTLEGEVASKYQEEAPEKAIKYLTGVKGITNEIKVKHPLKDVLEQKAVEQALKRNWSINSNDIQVSVNHSKVKLTGLVHSLYQKDEAGRLAWNAPGVLSVDNELAVAYDLASIY